MAPLQLSDHLVQNRQTGEQMMHVKQSHQIWILFVQHVPVRHLLSSLEILYHVIVQLQMAHYNC